MKGATSFKDTKVEILPPKKITTYAFIDASNIIYGTRDEGWKVDFKKLYKYLKERFGCKVVYYFAGLDSINTKQKNFYKLLSDFGYKMILKPVKIYSQPDGSKIRKANCDVDLTFYAMRDLPKFDRLILLSGDGDFEILLKYLVEIGKNVLILANSKRTAHEIKQLKGIQFNNLSVLRSTIEFRKK